MHAILRGILALSPALLGVAVVRADEDPLLRYFPADKDLPGLEAAGEGRHGSGEELTAIYDGGYKRYLDSGVLAASQRYFRFSGGTLEITLHEMNSEAAAKRFLSSLCSDIKSSAEGRSFKKVKGQMCVASTAGTAYGYLAVGNFLAMASFDRGDAKVPRAVLQAVGKRASPAPRSR
jgi:hypothetical protein